MMAAWLAMSAWQPVGEGARLYRQCQACHALERGANTPAGPTLFGVVGRSIAAERGFNYSPALRRFAARERQWTPDRLDHFLADPEAVVPGTEMSFDGIADPSQRRAIINWLAAKPGRSGRR